MPSTNPASHGEGLTLRQAALVAGFAYILNPVTFAEAYAYPKLVVPDNIGQTTHDISAHQGLFAAAIFSYLISFIGDGGSCLGALSPACASKQSSVAADRVVLRRNLTGWRCPPVPTTHGRDLFLKGRPSNRPRLLNLIGENEETERTCN
jgi:hypothetical protein